MSKGSNKGSSYEREICGVLSRWWSDGRYSDIFWRTSGSGSRAKTRSKKGQKTFGQYGDIQANNPLGQPLISLCTIEIKRGYSNTSFANILDKAEKASEQPFESFIYQAEEDAGNADTSTWLLIAKRDKRQSMIFMPYQFQKKLKLVGAMKGILPPITQFTLQTKTGEFYSIFGMLFCNFLKCVKPEHIRRVQLGAKNYYTPILKKNSKIRKKQPEYDPRLDQQLKCTKCDTENSVCWDGINWVCNECECINDYPR